MDLYQLWQALLALVCLVGASVAAVAQISTRALGQERIQEIVDSGRESRALRAWLDSPLRILVSILVARIALVALAATLLANVAHARWDGNAMWWAGMVAPAVHILVGEVLLGTWAKHKAGAVSELSLMLFMPVDILLWPISVVLAVLARRTALMITGGDEKSAASGPFLTEDDLARLVGLAPEAGQPQEPAHKLLQGVMQFHDTVVRDVMLPRTRMQALDVDAPPDEVVKTFARHGFTRLPVYQGSLDAVVGVLFMTDVISAAASGNPLNLRAAMRRPYFVPEFMKVEDLLREFQKRRTHMAVVVDEFGGTSGLVTLQDIVEEIVGDVRDEKSVNEQSIQPTAANAWMMDGRTSIDAVNAATGEELPYDGGYETLGGFLITRMGRLPAPGNVHRHGRLVMRVKEADERRVLKVLVEKVDEPAPEGAPQQGE